MTGPELLERLRHQRRSVRVRHQHTLTAVPTVQVSDWCLERPTPQLQGCLHTRHRALSLHIVVELTDGREHVRAQVTSRVFTERLVHRAERDSEALKQRPRDSEVVAVPGESRDVVEHDELHIAFVYTTIFQEHLEVWPVYGLRRFPCVGEHLGDLVALPFAILPTRT